MLIFIFVECYANIRFFCEQIGMWRMSFFAGTRYEYGGVLQQKQTTKNINIKKILKITENCKRKFSVFLAPNKKCVFFDSLLSKEFRSVLGANTFCFRRSRKTRKISISLISVRRHTLFWRINALECKVILDTCHRNKWQKIRKIHSIYSQFTIWWGACGLRSYWVGDYSWMHSFLGVMDSFFMKKKQKVRSRKEKVFTDSTKVGYEPG